MVILNKNRERIIQNKHEQILKVFQSLTDLLGKVAPEDVDFTNVPFSIEIDPKSKNINKIILDMSIESGKFNENTITLAQYSINKYFPDFQWLSKTDFPKRELVFRGLPKPPRLAMYPGSDYRPTGWIPLGLSGEGEIGWNIANPDEVGKSSYIFEDGDSPKTVTSPSAPQALTLGSTGGGKSIFIDQVIHVVKK